MVWVNNIIKLKFPTFGIGTYYRYGSYQFDKPINNLMVKMRLAFLYRNLYG